MLTLCVEAYRFCANSETSLRYLITLKTLPIRSSNETINFFTSSSFSCSFPAVIFNIFGIESDVHRNIANKLPRNYIANSAGELYLSCSLSLCDQEILDWTICKGFIYISHYRDFWTATLY